MRYGRESLLEMMAARHGAAAAHEVVDDLFAVVKPILNGANGFIIDAAGNRALSRSMKEEYKIPLPESVRENLPSLPGPAGLHRPPGGAGAETAGQPDTLPRCIRAAQPLPRAGDPGEAGQGRPACQQRRSGGGYAS